MPINPLYYPLSEQLMPAQRWLDTRDMRQTEDIEGMSRGMLQRAMQPPWQAVPQQWQMVPSQQQAPQDTLPMMSQEEISSLIQQPRPEQRILGTLGGMEGPSGGELPAVESAPDYQPPQRDISGFGGLGNWEEVPMGPVPRDPAMYAQSQPRTLQEEDLPPEGKVSFENLERPKSSLMEPQGPILDDRMAQTTLAKRASGMGWDPRRFIAAMAQMSGEVGNIRGKPIASTAPAYYEQMIGEEQKQRENDMKMEEMARRYAPKPADPMDEIKRELVKYQIEALRNKTQVDAELNDPNSERSVAFRGGWERLMRKQGFDKFQAAPTISGADVLKWLTATQMGINQTQVPGRLVSQQTFEAGEAEKGRTFKAEEAAKDRAAAMARTQAQQAGAMQRQAMKPAPKAAVPVPSGPQQPEVLVPGWKRVQNVPVRETELSKAREIVAQIPPIENEIKELQKYISKYGAYEMEQTEAGNRMKSLATSIQLKLKSDAFFQLGVLAGPDMQILVSQIPDTTDRANALKSDQAVVKQLGDVLNRLKSGVRSRMATLGFEQEGANQPQIGPRGKPLLQPQ